MAVNIRMSPQGRYTDFSNNENNQGVQQRPLYIRFFCCCSEANEQGSSGSGGQSRIIEKVKKNYTSSVVDPARTYSGSKSNAVNSSYPDAGSYQPQVIERATRRKSDYDMYVEKLMGNKNTPSASASDLAAALNH